MRNSVPLVSGRAHVVLPNSAVVPQNAKSLLTTDRATASSVVENYVICTDGLGREDLSYDYIADDAGTPLDLQRDMFSLLDLAWNCGLPTPVIDCATSKQVEEALNLSAKHGVAGFAARNAPWTPLPMTYFSHSIEMVAWSIPVRSIEPAVPTQPEALRRLGQPVAPAPIHPLRRARRRPAHRRRGFPDLVEVAASKKVDGARRLVLACLCIGEAKDSRSLGKSRVENSSARDQLGGTGRPDGRGNYAVQ